MIWVKTDAGRAEMQARALLKDRAQRNLLLVIDGVKSEEAIVASLGSIGPDDFTRLQALGLIAPGVPAGRASRSSGTSAPAVQPAAGGSPVDLDPEVAPLDYARFTAMLTQLISKELGLRGFVLTLAVEKAGTIEALRAVADRAIAQIGERKGEAAAAVARRALYGG